MSTLSDTSQSNIGWVYPPQPQTNISIIDEVLGLLSGTVLLVEDQDYIDVVFGSEQPSPDWVLIEASIINTTDSTPVNVWPGVMTGKTTTGFRLQLNGTPDSGNYILTWSIQGAFGYYLSGPTSSRRNVASTPFTVRLSDETTMTGSVVITPSDGGVGGTFTPSTVTLNAGQPAATFTYTPSTYGDRSIRVTNDRGLLNPPQIGFTSTASTYALSGPSTGGVGVESTDFTVELPVGSAVFGSVTVTPSDGGDGGTFTPTTVNLSTIAPSATFTYTPASSGSKTISVTNNGGLTNPANLTYNAVFSPNNLPDLILWLKADALSLANNDPVGTWPDSSSAANDFTQATAGNKPLFKTNIVNSLPVVRFDGSDDYLTRTANMMDGTDSYTIFAVIKSATIAAGSGNIFSSGISATNWYIQFRRDTANFGNYHLKSLGLHEVATDTSGVVAGAWNVVTADWDGANIHIWRNGTLKDTVAVTTSYGFGTYNAVGAFDPGLALQPWNGDIAEVVIYNAALSASDRQEVELYLKNKYGTP